MAFQHEKRQELIPFGPSTNCNLELCPVEFSIFGYRPSVAANVILLDIFLVLLIVHAALGILFKAQGSFLKAYSYTLCMVVGCVLQMVGYAGRLLLNSNPFKYEPFLMQLICITVAPVFYCAAVYVLLAEFITIADESLPRFPPKLLTWLFIPADVVCLILQAAGGGLSASATTVSDVNTGVTISKAGLILQVAVLTIFLGFSAGYLWAFHRRHRDAQLLETLRGFLSCTAAAMVLVLARCVYRVVELKDGYFSPSFRNQAEFVAFEGGFMFLAVILLAIGHPGLSLFRLQRQRQRGETIELDVWPGFVTAESSTAKLAGHEV